MTADEPEWRFRSPRNNLVCQQLLFWLSAGALAIAAYDLTQALQDSNLTASSILAIISASSSLGYLYLHWLISRQYLETDDSDLPFKKPSYVAIRVAAIAPVFWVLTAAWGLVLSARRSVCLPKSAIKFVGYWQAGDACIAHRAGVAVSLLAFIISCLFFAIIASDHHAFETYLWGHRKVQRDDDRSLSKCIETIRADARVISHSRNASAQSTTTLPRYAPTSPYQQFRPVPALQHQPYPSAPPSYRSYSPQHSRTATMTSNSSSPYMHSRSQSLTSLRTVQYYHPMQPIPALMADSAWRAVHPPAYQFRHVAQPYRPQTPQAMSMLRQIPPSPSYMQSRALYAASQSTRSHSRAGSMNRIYYAPNGAKLRSSPSNQSLSTRSASSGSGSGSGRSSSRTRTPPETGSLARPAVMAHRRAASDITASTSRPVGTPIANSMKNEWRGIPMPSAQAVRRMASAEQLQTRPSLRGAAVGQSSPARRPALRTAP